MITPTLPTYTTTTTDAPARNVRSSPGKFTQLEQDQIWTIFCLPIVLDILSDSCYTYDEIYIGLPLHQPGTDVNMYGSVDNAEDCHAICLNTTGCQWFNWMGLSGDDPYGVGECFIQTGAGPTSDTRTGAVTGPRDCSG